MNIVEEKAYAKINLALSIIGKEKNFHIIDSIVKNVNIFDRIAITERNDKHIVIRYINLGESIENDISYKTATRIRDFYKTNGMNIEIEKNIPFSAGLGGSSADAAGIARGMKRLFNLDDISKDLLLSLGSDVPYMYEGGEKRIRGKGEIIQNVSLPKLFIAILVCTEGVNTEKAYRLYDEIGGQNCDIDGIISNMNNSEPYSLRNALEKAAEIINPKIKNGRQMLKAAGFSKVVMSGSGSSILGIEKEENDFLEKVEKLKMIVSDEYKIFIA